MDLAQIIIYSLCTLIIVLLFVLSLKDRKIDAKENKEYEPKEKFLKKPYIYFLAVFPVLFLGILQIFAGSATPFVYIGIMLSIYIFFIAKHPQYIVINDEDTEPILKHNEHDANRSIEIIAIIAFALLITFLFIYKTPTVLTLQYFYPVIPGCFLGISIALSRNKSGKYFYKVKYLLISTVILIFCGFALGYGGTNLIALPIVLGLSSQYYNKWFMNFCAIITPVILIGFSIISYRFFGVVELSSLNLPPGTVLTIPESMWIEDAIKEIDLNTPEIFGSYIVNAIFGYILVFILEFLLFHRIQQGINRVLSNSVVAAKERAVLESDLEVAAHIQYSMLPTDFDDFKGADKVDIKATLFAAKEVGGDFYNFFSVDYDHVCILVGDVSGKGIPASLFMSKSQTSFKTIGLLEVGPSLIMKFVNNIMKEGNDENFFATVWLGIITLSTGDLEFVSAGHNAPLLAHANGKYEYMTEETDFVIGLMEDMEYTSYHRQLEPGDSILIYTDGVVDATNNSGEKYGEDRLLEFMDDIRKVTNQEKIDKLKQEVVDYTGDAMQFDDVTIMSVEFLGDKDGN